MAVEFQRERIGGVLVVTLSGRLDNDSTADFELFTQEAVAAGERHLLLDFAQLGYLSNAGVRALGSLSKSLATPTTSLRVAGVSPNVRQILDSAGVSILLDLYADRAAALASHPAASGQNLSAIMAGLLGLAPASVGDAPTPAQVKLAEVAFELLSGKQHHNRAAKAMAQGTQVMRRVSPAAVAAAPGAAAAGRSTAGRPAPWWKRLFGLGR